MRGARYYSPFSSHPRRFEHFSGPGVQESPRMGRLETLPSILSGDKGDMGDGHGLIRLELERPAPQVRELVPAAGMLENECLQLSLERSERLCIPPIPNDRAMLDEGQTGPSGTDPGMPLLAESILVPVDPGASNRHSESPSSLSGSPTGSRRIIPSSDQQRLSTINRLEVVRTSLGKQLLPERVVQLMLAGSRKTTHIAYQSAWQNWHNWCIQRNGDPLSASLNEVLSYLTDLFHSGMAYRTVNIHRSMISTTLPPIDGLSIGKHPMVSTLMRGIYNSNPPKPKYSVTWDVETVVNFISSREEESTSDLLYLSCRTACLLALATFMRISELAAIDLSSIRFSATGVMFSLLKARKTQRKGPLQSFTIAKLPETSLRVCPSRALDAYITATAPHRNDSNSSHLFIGTVRPFKPVTASTVGRWIKKVLTDSGVGSEFSAHSTRSAASSAAARKGMPVDSILKCASWASESTFVTYYKRGVSQPDATSVVLQP